MSNDVFRAGLPDKYVEYGYLTECGTSFSYAIILSFNNMPILNNFYDYS